MPDSDSYPYIAGGVAAAFLAAAFFRSSRKSVSRLDLNTPRGRMVQEALNAVGTPYQWGGGHAPGTWGLDCSGLVIVAHQRAGLPLPKVSMPTANGMWHGLPATDTPQPGDLAFYGYDPSKAVHVVIVTGPPDAQGNYPIVGANGGDSSTTTKEAAIAKNANVREEPTHLFWSRFLGFRRNSLEALDEDTPDAAVGFADLRPAVDLTPDPDEMSLA